jgi:glycosyltransferase involved in cell wall biosynthesis
LRTSLKLSQNSFVLLYLGSLGTWYLKDEMLTFFSLLKTKEPSAKFLILTPDIDSINPTDDIIVLTVTRSEVPVYCTLANAALCFIQPSFSKMASSATKVGEVLAMGIPIISNTGWGDMEIFSKSTSAISICDLKALADFNYLKLNSNPDDARAFAEANFSLQTGIAKYLETYNRV